MDTIKLKATVTMAAAIQGATGRAGETAVALSPEVLGALTEGQRARLVRHLSRPVGADAYTLAPGVGRSGVNLVLPGTDTSPGAVVAALGGWLDAIAARETQLVAKLDAAGPAAQVEQPAAGELGYGRVADAARVRYGSVAAELEEIAPDHPALTPVRSFVADARARLIAARRAAYLATPVRELVSTGWNVRQPDGDAYDAETRAHYDAACIERDRQKAEARVRDAEREAKVEQEKADREARRDAARAALSAYAIAHLPEYADAAADGYDVGDGVVAAIAEKIAALPDGPKGKVIRQGTTRWGETSWEEAKSPRAQAIELQRRVAAHVATIPACDGAEVDVSRVVRIEYRPEGEDAVKYRGVVVYLETAATDDLAVLFAAE